jgi:hypothetical protein
LLQNANDAKANVVEIRFNTDAGPADRSSRPSWDLHSTLIHSILVRNDGDVFNDLDWARLRKIAEGNPDEDKVIACRLSLSFR